MTSSRLEVEFVVSFSSDRSHPGDQQESDKVQVRGLILSQPDFWELLQGDVEVS